MAKRRASGEGMLRRRGKRWEARIVIGHAEDGKPIFHHISGKTQKEALAELIVQVKSEKKRLLAEMAAQEERENGKKRKKK